MPSKSKDPSFIPVPRQGYNADVVLRFFKTIYCNRINHLPYLIYIAPMSQLAWQSSHQIIFTFYIAYFQRTSKLNDNFNPHKNVTMEDNMIVGCIILCLLTWYFPDVRILCVGIHIEFVSNRFFHEMIVLYMIFHCKPCANISNASSHWRDERTR